MWRVIGACFILVGSSASGGSALMADDASGAGAFVSSGIEDMVVSVGKKSRDLFTYFVMDNMKRNSTFSKSKTLLL